MILDFYHNKIVKETVTEAFTRSVTSNLVPKLAEKYGDALLGIQMYEDYISDNFVADSYAYYPMTVILSDSHTTEWVKWSVEDKDLFKDGVVYSYVGESELEFSFAKPPVEFSHAIEGRNNYFESDVIPIEITTTIDPKRLSGKYSQTFIDILARAITREIERAMSVKGVGKSGLILEMPFAPDTYMEHTSENVTYRRLLISDKNSSAKDLWVKWTRRDGAIGYSVSDNVKESEIEFELGEDVSQKIREREYRFLTRISASKYQAAMGRKNVTEWRELIKRAVRRGELEKVVNEIEYAEHSSEVSDKLNEILNKIGYAPTPERKEPEPAPAYDEELTIAIERATETAAQTEENEDEVGDEPILSFGEGLEISPMTVDEPEEVEETEEAEDDEEIEEVEETEETEETEDDEEIEEVEEIEEIEEVEEIEKIEETEDDEEIEEVEEIEEAEEAEEVEEVEEIEEAEEAEEVEEVEETEDDEEIEEVEEIEKTDKPEQKTDDTAELIYKLREEKIRAEIEAKLRLEALTAEKEQLRGELDALTSENRRLTLDVQRLTEMLAATKLEAERKAELQKIEEERLRAKIEAQIKAEEREKDRLAEAAYMELERRKQEEAEAERKAKEEALLEEERLRREEEERIEKEREIERERLREEYEKAEAAAALAAKEIKYTSYTARFTFRHSVDPNSMVRIQELVKATVSHYGKDDLKIHIKASIPDSMTVQLDFIKIPEGEHELIVNIIKVLGNSGLGISKAVLD